MFDQSWLASEGWFRDCSDSILHGLERIVLLRVFIVLFRVLRFFGAPLVRKVLLML